MGAKDKILTLDLHGFRKDDVFDAVDLFIIKNHSATRLRILSGKGAGIVRQEVLRYLELGGYPWAYEVESSGSKNTGSIIVHMA